MQGHGLALFVVLQQAMVYELGDADESLRHKTGLVEVQAVMPAQSGVFCNMPLKRLLGLVRELQPRRVEISFQIDGCNLLKIV